MAGVGSVISHYHRHTGGDIRGLHFLVRYPGSSGGDIDERRPWRGNSRRLRAGGLGEVGGVLRLLDADAVDNARGRSKTGYSNIHSRLPHSLGRIFPAPRSAVCGRRLVVPGRILRADYAPELPSFLSEDLAAGDSARHLPVLADRLGSALDTHPQAVVIMPKPSCPASVRGIQDIHHRGTEAQRSRGEVSIPVLLTVSPSLWFKNWNSGYPGLAPGYDEIETILESPRHGAGRTLRL